MKTHELARALTMLAQALRSAPDQALDEFLSSSRSRLPADAENIPAALSTLVALSDFDKSQWLAFIREHDFPIDVRPRDASRDVIGKLLRYLELNRDARAKLANAVPKERSATSPELMRALQFLLKT